MLTLLRAPARRCSSPFSCTCERPRTHLRYFFISLKETLTQSTWQSFAVSQDPPDGYRIFAVSVDRQQPHNPNRSLTYWHNFKEKKIRGTIIHHTSRPYVEFADEHGLTTNVCFHLAGAMLEHHVRKCSCGARIGSQRTDSGSAYKLAIDIQAYLGSSRR